MIQKNKMKIASGQVKKLRQETGAGILACKQALQQAGGDIEKAIDILRVEGRARAAKREGREAREGVICLKVGDDGKKAVLLELNCETDFVARTPEFQQLADDLLEKVFSKGSEILEKEGVNQLLEFSGRIGEKMEIRRSLVWTKEGFIEGYLHHNNQLAVLVELNQPEPEVGREVAMQVAVSNPEYLTESDIPEEVEKKEKDIFRQQVKDKPEQIREKIVEGKWRKRLTEICLLDHPYIRDPIISVRQYLKNQGKDLEIRSFLRWRLGEE